jgi:hypothetical protein
MYHNFHMSLMYMIYLVHTFYSCLFCSEINFCLTMRNDNIFLNWCIIYWSCWFIYHFLYFKWCCYYCVKIITQKLLLFLQWRSLTIILYFGSHKDCLFLIFLLVFHSHHNSQHYLIYLFCLAMSIKLSLQKLSPIFLPIH